LKRTPRFFPTPQKEKSADKYFAPKPTPPSAETSKNKQKTTKNDPKRRQKHPQISKTRLRRNGENFQNASKHQQSTQTINRSWGGGKKIKK
jgi:CRISPR/Cas system CSM-associated protein Csm4 (group 5 of RAMP superfamily)